MDLKTFIENLPITKEEIIKATIGGALISIASSLNLALTGRITGWSNICFKSFTAPSESAYRWANIFGLILVSSTYTYLYGTVSHDSANQFLGDISIPLFLFAAFLVGFGTKLGNGCTSGHGVCGLPRLSIRSWVAVPVFLLSGILIATLRSMYPFENSGSMYYIAIAYALQNQYVYCIAMCVSGFSLLAMLIYFTFNKKSTEQTTDVLISALVGMIFGLGLILSGMVKKTKIIGFLVMDKNWDPSLLFVLLAAVGINFITFNIIIRGLNKPLAVNLKLDIPVNTTIDFKLVFGAMCFGVGWGLSGLCPGPVLINLFLYLPHLVLFLISLLVGQIAADKFGNWYDQQKLKVL